MWLPRSERFLKVTLLLEVQLQDRPLIFGETIPAPRVQSLIPEVHLVVVDDCRATVLPARNLYSALF